MPASLLRRALESTLVSTLLFAPVLRAAPTVAEQDAARLQAVVTFANNVLRDAADHERKDPSPLLANGVNVYTKAPLTWVMPSGQVTVISDLTVHQNLHRVLAGLSALTGDPRYKTAAKAEIAYYFAHFQDPGGLLEWGGHKFIDLRTLTPVAFAEKHGVHELKNVFPYYELMFEVDPAATTRFITGFWNAHVYNWHTLETSRHGEYGHPPGAHWNQTFDNPAPYFETKGLSFLDAGNDLIYAGAMLYRLTGDRGALVWSQRLAGQYVKARDPKTQLGAYQFTQPRKTADAPNDEATLSWYGDRAKRQFGPDFPGHRVLEATMLLNRMAVSIYGDNAYMQLELAEALGEPAGRDFRDWTHSGLTAFMHDAYDPATNTLRPMLTDGTDLTGFTLRRNGYYGRTGMTLARYDATAQFMMAYARGFLVTGDSALWAVARGIARHEGLGDIGRTPGTGMQLNLATRNHDYHALFSLLDLYAQTHLTDYLDLARAVGNNIVATHFHHGYFTAHADQIWANIDSPEPHALLALEAAVRGHPELVPYFLNSTGYIDGTYRFPDGTTHPITDAVLFRPRQSTSPVPVPGVRDPNSPKVE